MEQFMKERGGGKTTFIVAIPPFYYFTSDMHVDWLFINEVMRPLGNWNEIGFDNLNFSYCSGTCLSNNQKQLAKNYKISLSVKIVLLPFKQI